jgi:MinD-like ATPase involved in chromosome partitioning or flagellar assembly
LLLAAIETTRTVFLVEADEAGSSLATRFLLDPDGGVSNLYRREFDSDSLVQASQVLRLLPDCPPVNVVTGVTSEGRRARLAEYWAAFAANAVASDDLYIVDCGRYATESPVRPILQAADLTLLVTKPTVEDVYHAEMFVQRLQGLGAAQQIRAVVIGDGFHRVSDVASAISVPVVAGLPSDPKAASVLAGLEAGSEKFSKLPFVKAVAKLASNLEQPRRSSTEMRDIA